MTAIHKQINERNRDTKGGKKADGQIIDVRDDECCTKSTGPGSG